MLHVALYDKTKMHDLDRHGMDGVVVLSVIISSIHHMSDAALQNGSR